MNVPRVVAEAKAARADRQQAHVERVKAAIAQAWEASPGIIAARTGLPYGEVAGILRDLVASGAVRFQKVAVYSIRWPDEVYE